MTSRILTLCAFCFAVLLLFLGSSVNQIILSEIHNAVKSEENAQASPEAYPVDITLEARNGGSITASWSYMGTIISGIDWLELEICDSAMICETTLENTSLVSHTISGQTYTTHGETYTYTLKVCNEGGCNPTIATASATADNLVDGNVTITDMSVSNKAREEMWVVTWNFSGDTFDIFGWRVCYADYSWDTPSSMPTTDCVDAGSATVVEINHPVKLTKRYNFAAVAYDDKDNFIADIPRAEILYNANVDYTIVDSDMDGIDDLFDLCPDTEKGTEVDQTGCPPDSDKDGIIDSEDDCPNEFGTSYRGLQAARVLGCPDTDDDGWANSVDSFPEDPSEWFDSDNDGCGDNIDAFPADEFECSDTDGDGYGDNTDLFPEDPEEFSDLDGDGIGDSMDECDDSSSGDKLGENGCALTEDSSKLVNSLIYGGTGLITFVTIIAIVMLKMKKDSENEDNSEEWSTGESETFSEPFEETLYNTPQSHESGIFDSDGYEWLEYPDESGVWYWRNSPNDVWSEYK